MPVRSRTAADVVQSLFENASKQDNCWISHLRPNKKGYVPLGVGGRAGVKWRAHRFIYHHCVEPITEFDLILHSCDNRACINPEHLRKGTAHENTQDMYDRGRARNQYGSHGRKQ